MLYGRFLLVIVSSILWWWWLFIWKWLCRASGPSPQPRAAQAEQRCPAGSASVGWQSVALWPPWPGALSSRLAAACPVLCSGNGQYSKGTCQCYSGWKGAECDVPLNQCIDPSCGGHGSCIDGNCVCSAGYKGEHCEEGKPAGWAAVCRSGPLLVCFSALSKALYIENYAIQ